MAAQEGRLGVIAGAGALPIAIAKTASAKGRDVFVLGIEGVADSAAVAEFPHTFVPMGQLGLAIRRLKEAGCGVVTIAGRVAHPDFSKMKLDAKAMLALPRLTAAALKGDDALLRATLSLFENEGFAVIGSDEAAHELVAPAGNLGRFAPDVENEAEIAHGMSVVEALGALDIGQAAVICGGLVLAVEALEGTDAMLMRVASLPEYLRGTIERRRGVLVKAAKPRQERRVDLPVIGVRTIELASAAGLRGIAVEAGAALIVAKKEVIAAADEEGLFLCGVVGKRPV
jgi:DUF1009 family protein